MASLTPRIGTNIYTSHTHSQSSSDHLLERDNRKISLVHSWYIHVYIYVYVIELSYQNYNWKFKKLIARVS